MPRTIAIGDIHGCDVALETLLEAIAPEPEDVIITLGDIVDRGPNSRRCIEILLELRTHCNYLGILGNHEEMMLNVLREGQPPNRWLQFGGIATLDSYGFCGDIGVIPNDHIEFIEDFLPYHEIESHFFLHANYEPKKPLNLQSPAMLRWKSLEEYLPGPHMNGKVAILGHTAERSGEVFTIKHLVCIDTFCHGGKWLTAIEPTIGKVWQANQIGEIRE